MTWARITGMTILTAIDETHSSNPVVRVGDDLAAAYDDSLVVLHVVPRDISALDYSHESLPLDPGMDHAEKQTHAAAVAEEVTETTLGTTDRSHVRAVGRVGHPLEEVLAAAEEADARYIIVGGRQRSPVGKAVFGSTTQSILLRADRPMMTVRLDR